MVESNNHRWARLLKALLQQACHQVNRSQSKVLSAAACKALRQHYRTILTQGAKELPAIPPRTKGRRGRIAKSAAHNLHERLVKHEESVLRFLHDPHASFTNNAGERAENGQGENARLGLLSRASLRRGLCPYLQLLAVDGCARLLYSRRHPNSACRPSCRHGQGRQRPEANCGASRHKIYPWRNKSSMLGVLDSSVVVRCFCWEESCLRRHTARQQGWCFGRHSRGST
ncbi:MAG: transposase [Acidobacteriia bacterium]|nr:transposase [Terriglobia bacterium]MYG01317.1 transposase [Terriglobia bacterium]MYK09870.1 transposase [Terriglobia bacterium]